MWFGLWKLKFTTFVWEIKKEYQFFNITPKVKPVKALSNFVIGPVFYRKATSGTSMAFEKGSQLVASVADYFWCYLSSE